MARHLVMLLVLLNALYGSWAQGWLLPYGFGPAPHNEPQRLAQQIRPEAITLLRPDEVSALRQSAAAENAQCLQSGLMDDIQAGPVRAHLAASWPANSWVLQTVSSPERWLVYMGKYANLADLNKKRAELAAIQVSTEPVTSAALSPGLSLGAYTSQSQANTALQNLGRRGVRTARVVQDQVAVQGVRLRLPAVNAALQAQLPALKAVLPTGTLESCAEPVKGP
jgi:hypothetical protein